MSSRDGNNKNNSISYIITRSNNRLFDNYVRQLMLSD